MLFLFFFFFLHFFFFFFAAPAELFFFFFFLHFGTAQPALGPATPTHLSCVSSPKPSLSASGSIVAWTGMRPSVSAP